MPQEIIQLTADLDFSKIKVSNLKTTIEYYLEKIENQVDIVAKMSKEEITWENSIKELDNLEQEFGRLMSIVSHLRSVKEDKELDEVYKSCIPMLVEHSSKIGQNKELMNALKNLKEKDLNSVQSKILTEELKSFKNSGIDLPKEQQEKLNEINEKLQLLSDSFKDNVTNSIADFSLPVTLEELDGVPENLVKVFEGFAKEEDKEGYLIKLIAPYSIEVLKYLKNRDIREKIYKANSTIASKHLIEEYDNEPVLNEIVKLKTEKANLLGYEDYVELSLSKKMANSYEEIMDLMNQLKDKTKEKSHEEMNILKEYANQKEGLENLSPWDIGYYAEKYKNEKYNINSELIKEYFPIQKAKSGLFFLIEKLYGVTFKLREGDNLYHDDLYYYDLYKDDKKIASILMDLYARKNKLGGAWMSDYQNRFTYKTETDLPVAFIVCNFQNSIDDVPPLLSFDEVKTLFHEMGHALHHMLTEIDELSAAGISGVVWDAVELPSQFMEYFCVQPEILNEISGHYLTNEKVDLDLLDKLKQEEQYLNAIATMRQVELSVVDLNIHKNPNILPSEVLKNVRKETALIEIPEYDSFLNKFKHIFAGGYSAGYYSYKWADILSADIFESFEENGLLCKDTANKFLDTILAKGGSDDISDMFYRFKGRKPDINAYLKYNNL